MCGGRYGTMTGDFARTVFRVRSRAAKASADIRAHSNAKKRFRTGPELAVCVDVEHVSTCCARGRRECRTLRTGRAKFPQTHVCCIWSHPGFLQWTLPAAQSNLVNGTYPTTPLALDNDQPVSRRTKKDSTALLPMRRLHRYRR